MCAAARGTPAAIPPIGTSVVPASGLPKFTINDVRGAVGLPPVTSKPPAKKDPTAPPTVPPPTPRPGQEESRLPQKAGIGGSALGFLGNILGTVAGTLFGTNQQSSGQGTQTPPAPQTPTPAKSVVTLIANPNPIDAGRKANLSWSAVGSTECLVFDSANNQMGRGTPSGATTTPILSATSTFRVSCTGGAGAASGEIVVGVK